MQSIAPGMKRDTSHRNEILLSDLIGDQDDIATHPVGK